jgi:trimethylguanosine synthase
MGKRKRHIPTQTRKKRKIDPFWITKCQATPDYLTESATHHLYITRADLCDDFHTKRVSNNNSAQEPSTPPHDCNATQRLLHQFGKQSTPTQQTLPALPEQSADYRESATSTEAIISSVYTAIHVDPSVNTCRSFTLQYNSNINNNAHSSNGDCGDGIVNPYDSKVVNDKYWAQRHRLFSRFDEGIQIDAEGWYSVTPELIANHIASQIVIPGSSCETGLVVLDAFVGVGGNAIALARLPQVSKVICVDVDMKRLRMAANNCSVYGIATEKLVFVCGDAFDVFGAYSHGKLVRSPASKQESADLASDSPVLPPIDKNLVFEPHGETIQADYHVACVASSHAPLPDQAMIATSSPAASVITRSKERKQVAISHAHEVTTLLASTSSSITVNCGAVENDTPSTGTKSVKREEKTARQDPPGHAIRPGTPHNANNNFSIAAPAEVEEATLSKHDCSDASQADSHQRNNHSKATTINGCQNNTGIDDGDIGMSGYTFGNLDALPKTLDVAFLSPPWGGLDYIDAGPRGYELQNIKLDNGKNGCDILQSVAMALPIQGGCLVYYLPRNIDGRDVAANMMNVNIKKCVLEQNCVNGKLKTVTMYAKSGV